MNAYCDDCHSICDGIIGNQTNDFKIVIGICRLCKKVIVNRWVRDRSWFIRQPSKDNYSNLMVAEIGEENANKIPERKSVVKDSCNLEV